MSQLFRETRNLFFIRRLPKPHVSQEWQRPRTQEAFQDLLEYEGFISMRHWKANDLTQMATLKQDLEDLEEHLVPAFFEFNQKALHYQNRYILYQWVFMFGAFITTLLGALTTYAYTLSDDGGMAANVFGIMTAIVSGTSAYFNFVSDQGSPQRRWAKARRLAEELRMNYYRYLAHLEPFDKDDRVQQMRRMVIDIRRKEFQNG